MMDLEQKLRDALSAEPEHPNLLKFRLSKDIQMGIREYDST